MNLSDKIIDDQGNVKTFASGQNARLYYLDFQGNEKRYLLEGEVGGDENKNVKLEEVEQNNFSVKNAAIFKIELKEDNTEIQIDTSSLKNDEIATMELWLYMNEIKTFSIQNVTWLDEPDFSEGGFIYCVTLRWDGTRILANLAYSVEM